MNILLEEKSNKKKIESEINKSNNIEKLVNNELTEEKQNSFIETTLGKTINTAIDLGLKLVLPEMIEDEIINIKNVMIKCGLKEGINSAIKTAINLGKSAIGIVTGKFDDLSQVHTAIKKGGIIESVSEVLDNVLNSASKNSLISKGTSKLIKKGKNVILDTVSSNIEDKYLEDVNSLEKISKYISNWKNCYMQKDLAGMEREYKKIRSKLDTVICLESTISQAKKIENTHNFIKNKGIDYKLSNEEKELLNILK